MLGLRLGRATRASLVTTTPRPIRADAARDGDARDWSRRAGATRDNPHLPAAFLGAMEERYGGTRLGRQELEGELIEDVDGALWTRAMIEACRVAAAPGWCASSSRSIRRPGREARAAMRAGSSRSGSARTGRGYVLEDASVAGAVARRLGARGRGLRGAASRRPRRRREEPGRRDGGERAARGATPRCRCALVHASSGKVARAEPVAALYERGKVAHVGAFPALEDELCGLVAGGGYQRAGPVARPGGCAGLGADRADAGAPGRGGHSRALRS